jgi:ABC-type Fe3+-hydroxamate transport system substrate-binding protein
VSHREHVDDLGHTSRLPSSPARIVSLVPNLSELLWWWHLSDRVVAVTDWCTAPPRAFAGARRIRGTKNPDVAAIIDLDPDVVVANEEENRAVDVARLRAAGVAVHVTRVHALADVGPSLVRLAAALGAGEAGDDTAAAIARAVAGVSPAGRRVRAVCPIWREDPEGGGPAETWWVVGEDTFARDMLGLCGFDLLPVGGDGRYPRVPFGEILGWDPDVLLLPDEPYAFGAADAEEVRAAGVRVRRVDGTSLWWWGPRTPAAIRDLADLARQRRRPRRRTASPSGGRRPAAG